MHMAIIPQMYLVHPILGMRSYWKHLISRVEFILAAHELEHSDI